VENLAPPPEFDLRTVQPVAQSLYRLRYPGPSEKHQEGYKAGQQHLQNRILNRMMDPKDVNRRRELSKHNVLECLNVNSNDTVVR